MKRDHHPPSLRVEGTVDEWRVLPEPEHALDVVLHVFLVVDEVRIRPSVGGREKDLQAVTARREPHPRSDGDIGRALTKQRPLELADESGAEPSHDVEKGPS